MSPISEKRILEPEQVHQLWSTIVYMLKQISLNADDTSVTLASAVPIPSLHSQLKTDKKDSLFRKGAEPIETLVQQAIKEGLIIANSSDTQSSSQNVPLTNGTTSQPSVAATISLPIDVKGTAKSIVNGISGHDWYCFECHTPTAAKPLLECHQCWRVYHSSCVQAAYDFAVNLEIESDPSNNSAATESFSSRDIRARNFVCPVCTLTQKYSLYSVRSRQFSHEEFNNILSYAFSRLKTKTSQISRSLLNLKEQSPLSLSLSSFPDSTTSTGSPNFSELTTQIALQQLSFKSIDLSDIEDKISQSGYQSIGEFVGDCLSLKHVIEVAAVAAIELDSKRSRIRDTLDRMLEACRYDLKEMLVCVDCYRNSNQTVVDRHWFCRPCDPPHLLVFAKQKGYPYWPAKVIKPRYASVTADLDSFTEVDVRFFGAQHERSMIDRDCIKDINSSLAELGITKLNSSQEKALAELRQHRDMLEKFQKGITDVMDSNTEPEDGHKIKRNSAKRTISENNKELPARRKSRTSSTDDTGARSDSSAGSNAKRKMPLSRNERQPIKKRTARSNTTESENSVVSKGDSEVDKKSVATSEVDSAEFVDAREVLSENNDDDDDDGASTDVDESAINEDVKQPNSRKPRFSSKIAKDQSVEEDARQPVKRGRGRPRKYFPSDDATNDSSIKSRSPAKSKQSDVNNSRMRQKKVLYSPQTKLQKVSATSVPKPLSTYSSSVKLKTGNPRGRKPKSATSTASAGESNDNDRRPRRGRRAASSITTSPVKSPIKSSIVSTAKLTSPTSRLSNNNKSSLSPTRPIVKRLDKATRRRANVERQRFIEKRKLKLRKEQAQKNAALPKYIPSVTATKSLPPVLSITPSVSLNKSITSPLTLSPFQKTQPSFSMHPPPFVKPMLSPQMLSPLNGFNHQLTAGFSYQAQYSREIVQNGFTTFQIPKPSLASNNQLPQFSQSSTQPAAAPSKDSESKEESNAADKLSNMTNGDANDGAKETVSENGQLTVNNQDSNDVENDGNKNNIEQPELPEENNVLDDANKDVTDTEQKKDTADEFDDDDEYDDDEPDMIDDEQLLEQIDEYTTYQKEKELFEQGKQQFQLFQQQQQFLQHQQFLQMQANANRVLMSPPPNGFVNPHHQLPPTKPQATGRSNGFIEPPPKTYLEYSSSCIYSPTIRNRNLVNSYLHQIENKTFAGPKKDLLAQLILRKDEPEPEQVEAHIKKRGRPPKGSGDDIVDGSAKAKSIVEKSYLQESACNRGCLMKNIKTFKKFRDFVESQGKDEVNKHKREIEELKQEVYRLKNKKTELEDDLKRERELSKRCDPQLITQLEERHRRQLSEVKRKQWCTVCEAEASYFCCFNTNYCSRECQMKHWHLGHQRKCTRSRNNAASNVRISTDNAISQKSK